MKTRRLLDCVLYSLSRESWNLDRFVVSRDRHDGRGYCPERQRCLVRMGRGWLQKQRDLDVFHSEQARLVGNHRDLRRTPG